MEDTVNVMTRANSYRYPTMRDVGGDEQTNLRESRSDSELQSFKCYMYMMSAVSSISSPAGMSCLARDVMHSATRDVLNLELGST